MSKIIINKPTNNQFPSTQLGCHDRSRIATRAGAAYVDALNTLLLTLPGTPFLYYGEEIGMADVTVPVSIIAISYSSNSLALVCLSTRSKSNLVKTVNHDIVPMPSQ